MNPSRKVQTSPLVNRQILRPDNVPTKNNQFRSWREQADRSAGSSLNAPMAQAPVQNHHRSRAFRSLLRSRDFHVIVAVGVAVAIAYGAFYFLEGSL